MNTNQPSARDSGPVAAHWRQLAPPALGIIALMSFLALVRPPGDGYGWRLLFEIGHLPLFGVAALMMLRIVRVLRGAVLPERADFFIALLATVVLGLAAEALQIFQPGRHSNIGDALQNITGAFCFLAIAAALTPGVWRTLGPDGPVAARLVLAGATLLLVLGLMPLAGAAWSYAKRAEAFPVVAELTAGWQRPFLNVGRSELARVPAPPGWDAMAGERVARLTFLDAPWPGITVREPFPDWSAYGVLRFQVWSELEAPVELVLRVDDGHRRRAHQDRYNGSFIVTPGLNDFSVPLASIEQGPQERRLDLGEVSQFIIFSRRPSQPFYLYFSPFWLEEAG